MKQIVTTGIVLARTNFQEADRIITVLTPDQGKLRMIAKGVRRLKSKLAGGIELFSVSQLTYAPGRGELGTLISSRLLTHYGTIVQDINRTMLGYELIELLNKVTEDEPEQEYFELLQDAFDALDQPSISTDLIKFWFDAQLLQLAGHTPNLRTTTDGQPLAEEGTYLFSHEDMAFVLHPGAPYGVDDIKFLRLVFSGNKPKILGQIEGVDELIGPGLMLLQTILPNHIRT